MKRQQVAKKCRDIFMLMASAILVACGGEAGPMDNERAEDVPTTSQELIIKGDLGSVVVDPRIGDLTIKGDLGNIVAPEILALIFQGDFGNIYKPGDEATRQSLLALLKCVRAEVDAGAPLGTIRTMCGSPRSATR